MLLICCFQEYATCVCKQILILRVCCELLYTSKYTEGAFFGCFTVCVQIMGEILLHVSLHAPCTDPTAELQIARRKIHELESLNKHIQAEVGIHS